MQQLVVFSSLEHLVSDMPDLIELLTYYVIVAVVFVGAPGVFFFIVFMPALQNTKGRMVGYKDHKTYGDSTIYEVKRST